MARGDADELAVGFALEARLGDILVLSPSLQVAEHSWKIPSLLHLRVSVAPADSPLVKIRGDFIIKTILADLAEVNGRKQG